MDADKVCFRCEHPIGLDEPFYAERFHNGEAHPLGWFDHVKCRERDKARVEGAAVAFGLMGMAFAIKGRVSMEYHVPICEDQNHDNWDDEDDLPVTCTEPKFHAGDHVGGTRCGTITWPRKWK